MNNAITLVNYGEPGEYKKAKTEFIVFVKDGEKYSPSVYEELYQVYKENPLFRKLSMVAPAISTEIAIIYGWSVDAPGIASPRYSPSSTEPYAIQMGTVTGSLIRKAALDRINYTFTGNRLSDSTALSIALWESGQMCYLAPSVIQKGANSLDTAIPVVVNQDTQKLFKREMIG